LGTCHRRPAKKESDSSSRSCCRSYELQIPAPRGGIAYRVRPDCREVRSISELQSTFRGNVAIPAHSARTLHDHNSFLEERCRYADSMHEQRVEVPPW